MKNKLSKLLFGAAFACTGLAASAQGLEGVIVESYHTTTQADADLYNGLGNGSGTMTAGLTTYRIYIDMAPNYKLNSVFGSAGNVMDITSTTVFWNDDGFGSQFPPQTSRQDDGAVFDSWITIGRASRAAGAAGCTGNLEQLGVPRVSDTNGNLTMCNLWSGFGPTDNDGMVPGASLDPTVVGISVADLADFVDVDGGNAFSTTGSYALLPAQNGPELAGANRVLIAQVTTAGALTFHINVSLAAPAGGVEFYTHSTVESGSTISPFLTYPVVVTDADGDGVPDASDLCPGTAAGAGVNAQGCSCAQVTVDDGNPCTLDQCTNGVVTHTLQDADADGVCDANDTCPGTAAGAGVNTQGCSCAQVTVDDGNPCTLDQCTNGVVTHTVQDTDADGVCNANDACPGTAAGAGVNAQGCSCAQVTVDDGNPCTLDQCTNGVVTHTLQDADADGVCDANDTCPGTAAGAGVNTQGCSCAQVTVDDGNPCTLDQCTNGVVTHTVQDTDADGVCNANDACPGTAAGAGVNAQGCSCAQVTVDDGNPCTLDQCTNGVVTHTLQDADADGVCDANDTCPGTAAGAGVNTQGCSCAQVTVDDGNPCTLDQCTNGVVTHTVQDADLDGICDANDNCPNLPGVQGDPCNDGNAATQNDVITAACVCAGTLPSDCLGVPGGTAQPGTPCDDGLATTGNDTWSPSCVCAGQLIDCAGTPGGTALPGTACDDGLATTGNDTWSANCTCVGQLIDCEGTPGGAELPGTDCDDSNPNSTNDTWSANCVCSGTLANDCLGVPGGPAQPGTACDDGLATTGNDTWSAGCVCVGQLIDCEGVAGGTDLPGTACDDGLATTGNDTWSAGCVCVGQLIDCEGTPGGAELPGTDCNDGNPNTSSDTWSANCLCVGTQANDCLGVPGGPAQPGTACDDGLATTGNDTWSAACVCTGELIDCLGVPGGAALPGTACNDGLATTGNDTWSANCTCVGQLIDCQGVPGGSALPGTTCDDGNAATENDVYGTNCVCAGVNPNCNNNLELVFATDANGGQTSWEILPIGSVVPSCSGNGLASNSNVSEPCCLPDGCYRLRVLDGAGDGMTSGGFTGGYILMTEGSNVRIIDNRNNFSTGLESAISGQQGFCLPLGSDKLIYTSCDKLDWVSGEYVVASSNPAVSAQFGGPNAATSGYEFWIFDPNGTYSFRKFRSHTVSDGFAPNNASRACHMKINNWLGNQIPNNVLMNVRVRSRVSGVNSEWGAACRFKLDPARAACPFTKLNDIPGTPALSCGAMRNFGPGNNYIYARPVTGANKYQFRFRINGEAFETVRNSNTYILHLNWNILPLQNGITYDVDVRASKDGGVTWCTDPAPVAAPWGDICQLTIGSVGAQDGQQNLLMEGASLRMYPNPNRGDQLYLSLDAVEEGVNTVSVDIFDLFGKRVSARTIAVQDGFINTVLDLNGDLASGMYLVNITAGEQHFTERLVIQQ